MNIAGQFGLNACIAIRLPIQCPTLKCIVRVINVYCAPFGRTYCCRQFTHIYITFMVFYTPRFLYNLLSVLVMPFLALMSLPLYFSFSKTCHATSEKHFPLVLDLPRSYAVILNNQFHGAPCFSLVCCLQYAKAEIISASLFFSCSRKNVYSACNHF